jgi:hypothetical protein
LVPLWVTMAALWVGREARSTQAETVYEAEVSTTGPLVAICWPVLPVKVAALFPQVTPVAAAV